MADPALWRRLLSAEFDALRAQAAGADPASVADVARLRRGAPAEIVTLALELADARRRLEAKWPERAAWMVADRAGAEMASSAAAAAHKARRFAERFGVEGVLDLCCGIGADSIGLAEAGVRVTAVDVDPARAFMCGQNAGCEVRVADAASFADSAAPFHMDPARRSAGVSPGARGRWRLADHAPGPEVWRRLLTPGRSGAIKLGPGTDRGQVVEALGLVGSGVGAALEVEYLSEAGRLTQAVAWLGGLAGSASVSATMLREGASWTLRGEPGDAPPSRRSAAELSAGDFVYEADASAERAGLLGVLCREIDAGLGEMHPGLGLLAGDGEVRSPWLTGFRVIESGGFVAKRVRETLRSLGAGIVEVKTRGGACDPDAVQRELRGDGDRALVVFVVRLRGAGARDSELLAVVAERVGGGSTDPTIGARS